MNELPSATFRRVYPKLRETTVVTVNGHVIGTYTPVMAAIDSRTVDAIRPGEPPSSTAIRATSQAERDKILRKLNRTGQER